MNDIVALMLNASPVYMVLCLFCIFVSVLIQAFRFQVILHDVFKAKITAFGSFVAICGTQISGYITPFKAGIVLSKPALLKKYSDISVKDAFMATAIEQFSDIGWQMLALPILLILVGSNFVSISPAISVAVLVGMILVIILILFKYQSILRLLFRFTFLIPRRIREKLSRIGITKQKLIDESGFFIRSLSNHIFLVKMAFFVMVLLAINPLILYTSAYALGVSLTMKVTFFSYWISMIIGRLSGLPGGIGTRELSLVGVLVFYGIDPSSALLVSIIYRVLVVVFFAITGTPVLVKYGKNFAERMLKERKDEKA